MRRSDSLTVVRHGTLEMSVDRRLAPLVTASCRRGIVPSGCGLDGNHAFMVFETERMAATFLASVFPERGVPESALFGRAIGIVVSSQRARARKPANWSYSTHVFDSRLENDDPFERPAFFFPIAVHFPLADVATICKRLRKAPVTVARSELKRMTWPQLEATRAEFLRRRRDSIGPGFAELEAKLLAHGGALVVPMPERHLGKLLARGRAFDSMPILMAPGEPNRCHANAANEWLTNRERFRIVTGYALAENGDWLQHSWLWDGSAIFETTIAFIAYWGVVLSPTEVLEFTIGEVFAPEFATLTGGPAPTAEQGSTGGHRYKLRAECLTDTEALRAAFANAAIAVSNWSVNPAIDVGLPDVDLMFTCAEPIEILRRLISKIEDGHVMFETLALVAHEYTGERTDANHEASGGEAPTAGPRVSNRRVEARRGR
jgi:hypothetical protein